METGHVNSEQLPVELLDPETDLWTETLTVATVGSRAGLMITSLSLLSR